MQNEQELKAKKCRSNSDLLLAVALNVGVNQLIIELLDDPRLCLGFCGFWMGYILARPFGVLDDVKRTTHYILTKVSDYHAD